MTQEFESRIHKFFFSPKKKEFTILIAYFPLTLRQVSFLSRRQGLIYGTNRHSEQTFFFLVLPISIEPKYITFWPFCAIVFYLSICITKYHLTLHSYFKIQVLNFNSSFLIIL